MADKVKQYKKIVKVFNLLKPKATPPNAWDNVHDWLSNKAKLVLIVTQVIIVVIFVIKFLVDTEAKRLDELIISRDNQMKEAYTQVEPEIRQFQIRSKNYVLVWENSSKYSDVFREVSTFINTSDELTFSINEGLITITGFGERNALTDFEIAIRNSDSFYDVEAFEIKAEGSDLISGNRNFGLRARISTDISREL